MSDILAHPPTLAATLGLQLSYTYGALKRNLGGIDAETALRRPQGGGSHINWLVGHVLNSRQIMLSLLGKPALDERLPALYDRGVELPDASNALPLEHLVELLDGSQKSLSDSMGEATGQIFAKEAPFSPRGADDETVGSLLAGLAFHEAYHVGQVGSVRRALGFDGVIG